MEINYITQSIKIRLDGDNVELFAKLFAKLQKESSRAGFNSMFNQKERNMIGEIVAELKGLEVIEEEY